MRFLPRDGVVRAPLVSTKEAAEKAGIKVESLRERMSRDKGRPIPVFKRSMGGGCAYYRKPEMESWLSRILKREIKL